MRAPPSSWLAVLAGACLLAWPAWVNGYPIAYSDTGGFLEQALMPDIGWDKPWIYGPFLTPFHLQISLWPAIAAQALILSALLWLTQAAIAGPTALRHLLLAAILALGSAAPWFAPLLMPDIFAPVTVLALFVLTAGSARRHPPTVAWVGIVATVAIAAHLAHLLLAAASLAALSLMTRRLLWRQAIPLLAALSLLALGNLVGNRALAISPYGSVFALARLVADGPAATTIRHACPQAGWHVCAWADRLPADSDEFLWDPYGPVWANGYGPIRFAPEAAAIVRDTLLTEPAAVAAAALRNTGRQLLMAAVGDALVPDHLAIAVRTRLQTYFPPAEVARFDASRQAQGTLPQLAAPFLGLHVALLAAGTAGTAVLALAQWRRNRTLAMLASLVLVALLANAASTGALSGPHSRYQARIAWLVLLPPVLAAMAPPRRRFN